MNWAGGKILILKKFISGCLAGLVEFLLLVDRDYLEVGWVCFSAWEIEIYRVIFLYHLTPPRGGYELNVGVLGVFGGLDYMKLIILFC